MSLQSSDLLPSGRLEKQANSVTSQSDVPRSVLYTYLALLGAILCVYAGVAGCDFINADDTGYIHYNSFVRTGLSWENVQSAFTSFEGSLWIPLTWISFMLDVSLFGLNPMGFHIENLLFHAATALLLLHGLHRATGRFWPSVVVAALFGLHPVNVESIAWVTERKNVLCAFFWVLSMNAYLRYGATARKQSYGWALVWFVLALMSKPMAVTLPGTLLLLDLWPLRRDLSRWRTLLLEKLPFIAFSVGACLLAMHGPRHRDTLISHELLPMDARLSNAVISYVFYLRDFFWPANLSTLYPHPNEVQPVLAAISVAIVLGITGCTLWYYRSRPYLLVGWLWFLGVLVPMLGLVQIGTQARADRFTYVAQIGVFVAVVWLIADLWSAHHRRLLAGIAALVLVAFAGKTATEVPYWSDTATLFERAIEEAGPSMFAHVLAGRARSRQGDNERAAAHFAAALDLQPNHHDIWCSYGRTLKNLKRTEEAVRALAVAIRLNPKDAESRYVLAMTFEEAGQLDAALKYFKEAVQLDSRAPQTHEAIGRILTQKGFTKEAEPYLNEAGRLRSEKGTDGPLNSTAKER